MLIPVKPIVKIRHMNFWDGFNDDICRTHVLMDLCDEYDFVFCDTPDILLVGCYGQQSVTATTAVKVGYYTENLAPDLKLFDYFFGCEYTDYVGSPKYCKRVFGRRDYSKLSVCKDPERTLQAKTRFCNYIYSSRVPLRERFFKSLSGYRAVTAPGMSMNNSKELSSRGSQNWHNDKIDYLRDFKFTIAMENSRRIGYATEKLYDAFEADTIPLYWGDPSLDTIVNRDAVIFIEGDWERDVLPWLRLPEKREPFRPYYRASGLKNSICGRANDVFKWLRARVPYTKGFSAAIEEVVHLDRDDRAYVKKLSHPRLKDAIVQQRVDYFEFWRGIIRRAVPELAA